MSDRTQSSVDVESSEQPNSPESAEERHSCLEWPSYRDLLQQLKASTHQPLERLKKTNTVAELRAFWEERSDDLYTAETLAVAPEYIHMTWAIMRRLFYEGSVPAPPPEPKKIVRPLYDKTGTPKPPGQPDVLSDGYRCRSAYLDVHGKEIPVNERNLRKAVDKILKWCRDVERRDEEDEPLLDRIADILTVQQNKIIKHIWKKKGASFDALTQIPRAFREMPDDETIIKALQRTQQRLNKYPEYRISLSVSKPKRRVQLERPPDK